MIHFMLASWPHYFHIKFNLVSGVVLGSLGFRVCYTFETKLFFSGPKRVSLFFPNKHMFRGPSHVSWSQLTLSQLVCLDKKTWICELDPKNIVSFSGIVLKYSEKVCEKLKKNTSKLLPFVELMFIYKRVVTTSCKKTFINIHPHLYVAVKVLRCMDEFDFFY